MTSAPHTTSGAFFLFRASPDAKTTDHGPQPLPLRYKYR